MSECYICKSEPAGVPFLEFCWLEGSPKICEQCLFKLLTGDKVEWINANKKPQA